MKPYLFINATTAKSWKSNVPINWLSIKNRTQ